MIGQHRPWRLELWSRSANQQQPFHRSLLTKKLHEFQGRRVCPVQILEYENRGLNTRQTESPFHEHPQQALALLLSGQRRRRISLKNRQFEYVRDQWQRLRDLESRQFKCAFNSGKRVS